jgi:L-asparaginase
VNPVPYAGRVLDAAVREVTVLAAGGTIGMRPGEDGGAVPRLDADGLLEAVPALAGVTGLRARTISTRPSVQLTAAEALDIARAAAAEADAGRGVVVTHGTDTLEEVALLCDLLYAGEAPIVFTGAMRHASALGADGPANLFDAVVVAGASGAEGLGVLVVFAGTVHAARAVRKADSTAPAAFDSPRLGPIGRVQEGRAWMARRLERFPPVPVASLDATVHIVPAALGADGSLVDAAVESGADGLVGVVLGAGHTPPPFLAALKRAAAGVPVVVTVRPERGSILRGTYAFEGAERDLRAGPLICAAALSPAAARIKLLACLGAGYARGAIAGAFGSDDF